MKGRVVMKSLSLNVISPLTRSGTKMMVRSTSRYSNYNGVFYITATPTSFSNRSLKMSS